MNSPSDRQEETTDETRTMTASETQGDTTTEARTGMAVGTETNEETTMTVGPTTDTIPPDIPRPGTPPRPTGTRFDRGSCSLSHEIVASGDELTPGTATPVMRYENFSPAAKRLVRRVVESGGVTLPYDSPNRPPEFAYSDEVHRYDIEYRGTVYRLFTYSNVGCPGITASE